MPEWNSVGLGQAIGGTFVIADKLGNVEVRNRRTCQLVSLEMPKTTSLIPGGLRARIGALECHEHISQYFPFNDLKIPMSILIGFTTRTGLLSKFNDNAMRKNVYSVSDKREGIWAYFWPIKFLPLK